MLLIGSFLDNSKMLSDFIKNLNLCTSKYIISIFNVCKAKMSCMMSEIGFPEVFNLYPQVGLLSELLKYFQINTTSFLLITCF